MLPLPNTKKTGVVAFKPNQAGVECMGGQGALGPGDEQGRRGAERDGLGKQQGLTHTHPQG